MATEEQLLAAIKQLQTQQGLFTSSLKSMLEGRWTGAESVEAFLYALNPNYQGTLVLDVPIIESEYEDPKA